MTSSKVDGAHRTGSAAAAGAGLVLLLQSESSAEVRAALVAAAVMGCETRRLTLRSLQVDHQVRGALALEKAPILPVGSVEFVRAAMSALGVREPEPMGYEGLQDYLQRHAGRTTVGALAELRVPAFVKPVATKLFTGFVYDPAQAGSPEQASTGGVSCEHVAEQTAALSKLSPDTPLWISDPVHFQCEWRYYVDAGGRILAQARYDADGADDAPLPSAEVVRCAIDALVMHLAARGDPHPFALDMGVLDNGRTACVEPNDAWAIGLYGHARTPAGTDWSARGYVEFLLQRWRTMVAQARRRKGERTAVDPDDVDEEDDVADGSDSSCDRSPRARTRRPRRPAHGAVTEN